MTKINNFNRGDSRDIDVTFLQSDGVTPHDLTAATVYFTANSDGSPTDNTTAAVHKTVTVHTAPLLGQTTVHILPADTQDVAPGKYFYDVQATLADGSKTSKKRDVWTIDPDISRD